MNDNLCSSNTNSEEIPILPIYQNYQSSHSQEITHRRTENIIKTTPLIVSDSMKEKMLLTLKSYDDKLNSDFFKFFRSCLIIVQAICFMVIVYSPLDFYLVVSSLAIFIPSCMLYQSLEKKDYKWYLCFKYSVFVIFFSVVVTVFIKLTYDIFYKPKTIYQFRMVEDVVFWCFLLIFSSPCICVIWYILTLGDKTFKTLRKRDAILKALKEA